MAAEQQIVSVETLQTALKHVQELRASVSKVFQTLGDGKKETEDPSKKEKVFLTDLQQSLLRVNQELSDLEKVTNSMPSGGSQQNLGNSAILSLDSSNDRLPLHAQLLQSYRWSSKVQEHANYAFNLLNQNTLKRSPWSGPIGAKRRKQHATANVVVQPVDGLVQNISRMFTDVNIQLSRPMGSPAILQLTLGRTLKAVIIMRGITVERVVVKALSEEFTEENGQIDVWTQSKYKVFQKVTDHCNSAMLHFHHAIYPELAMKSFMMWFRSYNNLFSAKCHMCGKHLEDGHPPTWRDLSNAQAYHEQCRL